MNRFKDLSERRNFSKYKDSKIAQLSNGVNSLSNMHHSTGGSSGGTNDYDGTENNSTGQKQGQLHGEEKEFSNSSSRGGSNMGLDILQMSLDAIQASATATATATATVTDSNTASNSISTKNRTTTSSNTSAPYNPSIPPPVVSAVQARARTKNARYGGFDDLLLQEHAPLCPGHQEKTKLVKVNKAGPNKVQNHQFSSFFTLPIFIFCCVKFSRMYSFLEAL